MVNVDNLRRPPVLKPFQNFMWYDVDRPIDKEEYDKMVNRICYSMLFVMGLVLTIGFLIVVVTVIRSKE